MPPQASRRILFIKSGSPVDVLMTTPAVRLVREAFPHAHISYLASQGSIEVLANNPRVDEVIALEEKILLSRNYLDFIRLVAGLRGKKFDTVIAFQSDRLVHFISYLTGASCRVAVSGPGGRYLTHRLDLAGRETTQPAELYVELTGAIGTAGKLYPMELFVSDKEKEYAQKFRELNLGGMSPVIGLFPGGKYLPRVDKSRGRWSAERFSRLCGLILMRYPGCGIVVFGQEDERHMSLRRSGLRGHPSIVDVMGRTTLRETVSLMGLLDLAVTDGFWPRHFSAALGIPVVSLSRAPAPYQKDAGGLWTASTNPQSVFNACVGVLGPPGTMQESPAKY